jgi:hypothetical protein
LSDEPEKKSEILDGSQRELEDDGVDTAGATLEDDGVDAAGATLEDDGVDAAAATLEDDGTDAAGGAAALAAGAGAAGPPNRLLPPLQPDASSTTPSRAAIANPSRQRIWISPRQTPTGPR